MPGTTARFGESNDEKEPNRTLCKLHLVASDFLNINFLQLRYHSIGHTNEPIKFDVLGRS